MASASALALLLACSSSSSSTPTPTPVLRHVGGTVSGLAPGTSVVLQVNGGNDLTVNANGSFVFPTTIPNGTAYAVTVLTSPSGASCAVVSGGEGNATADVSNVQVTCAPIAPGTYAISGTVSGLTASGLVLHLAAGAGEDLAVPSGATTFAFATRVVNGSYTVSVLQQPGGYSCSLANGSVVVSGADVSNVTVTCVAVVLQRWASPASWGSGGPSGTAWPDSPTMVQHAYFDAGGLRELKSITWGWQGSFAGAPAAEPPTAQLGGLSTGLRYAGGPFTQEGMRYQASAGDATLDLPGDMLVCAIVRPWFDPVDDGREYPIIAKGIGNATQDIPNGGWVLLQSHQAFRFQYELRDSTDNSHLAFAFKLTRNATGDTTGNSVAPADPTVAKRASGPLNSSFSVICGGRDGNRIVVAANGLDDMDVEALVGGPRTYGPPPFALDAAGALYPATLGGYSAPSSSFANPGTPSPSHRFPGRIFETAVWSEPATEANLRAKFEAVQGLVAGARYARNREGPFIGSTDGRLHTAPRNTPRIDPAKGFLFGLQGWNRVSFWMPGDLAQPLPMIFAPGEWLVPGALETPTPVPYGFTATAGVAADRGVAAVPVPGDGALTAPLLTIPAGGSISIALDAPLANPNCVANAAECSPNPTPDRTYPIWDSTGPIQGQVWLRVPTVPAAGTVLRIRKDQPAAELANPNGSAAADNYLVDLSTLTANEWRRFSLSGALSDGTCAGLATTCGGLLSTVNPFTRGTLTIENPNPAAVHFHAWGLQLTQIGGGLDPLDTDAAALLAFDSGPAMYDWSASLDSSSSDQTRHTVDVLELPAVRSLGPSTADSGFCLSVDAQPMDGLAWVAPMRNDRTVVTWIDRLDSTTTPATIARIFVTGADSPTPKQLCFALGAPASPSMACVAVPAAWAAGSKHNLKGCVNPAGGLRLLADDVQVASGTGAPPPDLSTGHLLIGNDQNQALTAQTPWHGFVSQVLVCRDGPLAACR